MNGFLPLSDLFSIPCDKPVPLTQLVGEILEVHPCQTVSGGSQQMIVVRTRGSAGVFLLLYELREAIAQSFTGGVVRITSSPTAKRGLNWERSKADRAVRGVLVARNHSKVEIYTAAQAAQLKISEFGFMRSTVVIDQPDAPPPMAQPAPAPALQPAVPAQNMPNTPFHGYNAPNHPGVYVPPVPVPMPSHVPHFSPGMSAVMPAPLSDAIVRAAAECYFQCWRWASSTLGPQAHPDDVRAAAGAVFHKLYS